jgi:hypothetical protein
MSSINFKMKGCKFLFIILFIFYPGWNLYAVNKDLSRSHNPVQDTIREDQTLYNGKIWRNLYYMIKEDQFLFSKEFLPGSVWIRGKLFTNVLLKYDIYKDELITPFDDGKLLQLNKEMIDSFSLSFQNTKYRFIKAREDSLKETKSFFNILYNGKTSLLVKYSKKIDKMAVEGKYDEFYLIRKVYLDMGNGLLQVTGKKDLLKYLPEKQAQVKEYMKINKLRVSEKTPGSFLPVIRFYDSLMSGL